MPSSYVSDRRETCSDQIYHALPIYCYQENHQDGSDFVLIWIVSLTPVIFKFMGVPKIHSLAVPGFLLFVVSSCIIFVVSVYAVLYLETRRHQKLIKRRQMPQEEVQRVLKENKALQTTVYVVGAVAVCYLPLALQIANLLKKRTAIIAPELIRTVVLLNSLLNPLVYCWRQKEIRKFVFKTKTQAVNPHSE